MSRTSIDGLTVRPSRSLKPRSNSTSAPRSKTKNTARTTDITRPKTRSNSSFKQNPLDEDFIGPVEGLSLTDVDEQFSETNTDDWSELLNEFGDKKTLDTDLSDEEGLFASEDSSTSKPKSKKQKKGKPNDKPKKKHKIRRRVLLTLFLLLITAGVILFIWGDSIISRLTNGQSGLWDVFGSVMSETVPFETDEHGRTNILVFGTGGYDMDGSVNGTQHDGADLTDSIMVVSFDQETKDVALLSIPRDLKVSQACFAGKVNEVYTCNKSDRSNEAPRSEA